jgi:hypothetical protein
MKRDAHPCLFFFLHLDGLNTPIQPKPPLYPSPQTQLVGTRCIIHPVDPPHPILNPSFNRSLFMTGLKKEQFWKSVRCFWRDIWWGITSIPRKVTNPSEQKSWVGEEKKKKRTYKGNSWTQKNKQEQNVNWLFRGWKFRKLFTKKKRKKEKKENLLFLNTEETGPKPELIECFEVQSLWGRGFIMARTITEKLPTQKRKSQQRWCWKGKQKGQQRRRRKRICWSCCFFVVILLQYAQLDLLFHHQRCHSACHNKTPTLKTSQASAHQKMMKEEHVCLPCPLAGIHICTCL